MIKPLPPRIKGWCPTITKPMLSGDGLLMRLSIESPLAPKIFKQIGDLAQAFGNGLVDLTQRGNLQIRGVRESGVHALQQAIAGLDFLQSEEQPSIPQIIGTSLAGLDRNALQKIGSLITDLRCALTAAEFDSNLPAKFCLLVDDGGCFSLDSVAADIRLVGVENGFIIAIGTRKPAALAHVAVEKAVEAIISLTAVFARHAPHLQARRMDDLINALGIARIAHLAGLPVMEKPLLPRSFQPDSLIGSHDNFLGVAAPFGRLNTNQIHRLAEAAENGIIITPWRSILLSEIKKDADIPLSHAELITDKDDPRLSIVACPGRPSCECAEIDTHGLAERLAPLLRHTLNCGSPFIHLSGCKKGCAHGNPAPITLVGERGAINFVRNGRADHTPQQEGLTEAQAQALIIELSSEQQSAKVSA